jgi:hypothetical protein
MRILYRSNPPINSMLDGFVSTNRKDRGRRYPTVSVLFSFRKKYRNRKIPGIIMESGLRLFTVSEM